MNTTSDIQENTSRNYKEVPFVIPYSRGIYRYMNTTSVFDIDYDLEKELEKSRIHHQELEKLKENIGDKLYNELNQQQRDWIVRTEGSIKLNRDYTKEDFERISDYLNESYE